MKKNIKLSSAQKIFLFLIPFIAAILSLSAGRMYISFMDVLKCCANLFGADFAVNAQIQTVVQTIRLPRIILAVLVGSGLSVSGTTFQSLFSNPLATPDTLGVASGSCFGAALGILLGFHLIGIQILSVLFGLAAVILTFISGMGKQKNIGTTVLAGIMIGSLFSGLVSLLKFVADTDTQLPAITFWLMGSLSGAGFKTLLLGSPMIIIGIIMIFAIRWRLNLLPLSPEEAYASGTNIQLLQTVSALCATVITASCVSMCGQVGWVGLLVPHICRMKFGSNHTSLIPASISYGAVFMLIVDTIARCISPSEIPVSVLTAIIGAPFFIFLMRKTGGWQL